MLILGISGSKRSGKDTFALYVKDEMEKMGKTVTVAAWADLLKKSAYESLGIAKDSKYKFYSAWANSFKQNHTLQIVNEEGQVIHEISGREYLQRFGTEAHRDIFSEDFWIEQLWAANDFSDTDVVIITDCRYDNEARNILKNDGFVIKINNPKADLGEDSHASEQGIDSLLVNFQIDNDSSLEELEEKAVALTQEILTF